MPLTFKNEEQSLKLKLLKTFLASFTYNLIFGRSYYLRP